MIKTQETKLIKVSQIKVDQGINPRSETNQDKVSEYLDRLSFSQAPAIKVAPMGDGRYLLIDGNHRLQAYQKTEADEILADILDVDGKDTLQMDILALSFNLDHGLCVEPEMLRNKARYYCTKGLSIKEIMDIIRRPERTIRYWTEDIRKEQKDEKAKTISELEGKESLSTIAEKVGLSKEGVASHIKKKRVFSATIAGNTLPAETTGRKKDSPKPSLDNDIKQLMDILNSNLIPTLSSFLELIAEMPSKISAAAKDNTIDKDILKAFSSAIDKNSQSFKLIHDIQINIALTNNSITKAIDVTFDPVKELCKWYQEDLFDTNVITDFGTCENAIKSIFLQVLPRHNDSKQAIKEIKKVYTYYCSANTRNFQSKYHRVFIGDRSFTALSRFYDIVRDLMLESENHDISVPDSQFRQSGVVG